MSLRGWCLMLACGREFSWTERDGVWSEEDARARLAEQEPGAVVVDARVEEIVTEIRMEMN